jgi:hypothetical protein
MPHRAFPQILAAFVLVCSLEAPAQSEERFLSWYNGWGSHHVWGMGRVPGSYENASVECGEKQIKVEAIYDMHASRGLPPTPKQSENFARSHNVAYAKVLATQGIKCEFQPEQERK